MGRMGVVKWDKAQRCNPVHNIISSDFPKYSPQPWKFMEGRPRIGWLLSNEYQRMWLAERELWKKRMYPENTTVNVDIVKSYVLTFKNAHQPPKPEKKKLFKMKKTLAMRLQKKIGSRNYKKYQEEQLNDALADIVDGKNVFLPYQKHKRFLLKHYTISIKGNIQEKKQVHRP